MATDNENGDSTKSKKDLAELHATAKRQFERAQSVMVDERKMALEDRRFYSIAGAQWEGPLSEQFENKPKLEFNKVHLAVMRIINEYRNNRITVNFIPKDGSKGGVLTDTCNGLYRADEENSVAEEAYDNGFEEAVGGGFGAFRYKNDYVDKEDEDNEEQAIFIEPIFDADSSVYFDPDAKRQDKSDARYCFVLSSMTKEAFEEAYPGKMTTGLANTTKETYFDWFTPDVTYVAEYYKKEQVKVTVLQFKGLTGEIKKYTQEEIDDAKEDDEDIIGELKDTGFKKIKEKQITRTKVHKYIISGAEVLEDLNYIAGKNIPIVPIYGKRWFVDNVERSMGHVRLSKDAQRLKNMQVSKVAEVASLSTVEKPIFTPQQIAGHQLRWAEDNIKNYPFMLINPLTDGNGQTVAQGPVAYTKAPSVPQAMMALLQLTDTDIAALLGNQEAGEVATPNTSGIAMELAQAKLDMQTYIYVSNFAKAMRRGGEIWLSMAKEVYVENSRKRKVIDKSGEASSVTLNAPGKDEETGVASIQNNLTEADFDVVATPGPTSASKKAAIVKSLIGLLQYVQDPETVQVIVSMIMTNLEGEGIEEIRDYFRNKLLTMGVAKPTPEEADMLKKMQEEAANAPPDANTQFLQSSAKAQEAEAVKNQASTVKIAADAEKARAETMQILQDIHSGKVDSLMTAMERLQAIIANGGPLPSAPPASDAPQPPQAQPAPHIVQISQ